MPYVTVFEITHEPFQWWFPASGLMFVAGGIVLILTGRKRPSQERVKIGVTFHSRKRVRRGGYFMLSFASLWVLGAFGSMYSQYRRCVEKYRHGEYSVVEGDVEDFDPMPYEGHQDECFTVQGKRFCYSDYSIQAGFNQSASHGGPIRQGLPVRIAFSGDKILRVEIRADRMPSASERYEYMKKAKAKCSSC